MTFGALVDWIIAIVAIVVLWQAIKYLIRFLGWVERSEIARQKSEDEAERRKSAASAAPASAAAPLPAAQGVPAHHVAAIAAAVAAYGYRVIHIEDQAGHAWASEGRWMHQTSHQVSNRGY